MPASARAPTTRGPELQATAEEQATGGRREAVEEPLLPRWEKGPGQPLPSLRGEEEVYCGMTGKEEEALP